MVSGRRTSYRQVSLVDSQEENELGQAESSCQIPSNPMLVGAQGSQDGEEEEGEQKGSQCDAQSHIGQCLQRQDLSILQGQCQGLSKKLVE